MPRAVIDTNILISGVISPHGCPRAILEHWYDRTFIIHHLSVSDDGIDAGDGISSPTGKVRCA